MLRKHKAWVLGMSSLLLMGSLSSCKKDTVGDNESELITTVEITLTDRANANNRNVFTFVDIDGEGGNNPIVQEIVLNAGAQYDCSIRFLDQSKNPVDDITLEVAEEDDEHEVFIIPSPAERLTVSNRNLDGGGLPLGLTSTWTAGTVGTGTVRVVLKHKPDGEKRAGDDVNVGETDIDVTFQLRVL
jgi:hypothetical protein